MLSILKRANKKELILCAVFVLALVILALIPTGFQRQIYFNSEGARATVLSVDDSGVYNTGLILQGEQRCEIRVESGEHRGEVTQAINLYTGKIEFDKTFSAGQSAWVLLERDAQGKIIFANMVDHYRISKELLLICLFALLLILFSGFTGVRTLLSFALALFGIWKLLIPLTLKGHSPLLIALLVGNAITVSTLLLVAGFTRKALAAMISAVICSLATCLLSVVFVRYFNIHGAVLQWSESLLYAGYMNLDLTGVFQAGIYLACSGAILDLAIDISAALDEIVVNQPVVTFSGLLKSGMRMGRSVVGSQTTTLLLAYMGSYISVMMVYMAQGTPMLSILNSKAISAEILHTFVGCIGLVLVCPLTSLIGALINRPEALRRVCAKR